MVIPQNVFIVRGELLGIELEATDIETIAATPRIIVRSRYLIQMGRQERIQYGTERWLA